MSLESELRSERVSHLRLSGFTAVPAGTSVRDALGRMRAERNTVCLITKERKLNGIFTERDVLMRVTGLVDDLAHAAIGDYMTSNPVALKADLPIAQALHLMSLHGFRHLPLVDEENRPTGIISFRDVVGYLNRSLA